MSDGIGEGHYGPCKDNNHCRCYKTGRARCCSDGCGATPPGKTALGCPCGRVNLWPWDGLDVGSKLVCPKCGITSLVIDTSPPHYIRGRTYPDMSDLERRDAIIAKLHGALRDLRDSVAPVPVGDYDGVDCAVCHASLVEDENERHERGCAWHMADELLCSLERKDRA